MAIMKRLLLGAAVLLTASGLAFAQGAPKWSYIEGGFIDFDPDSGVSDDGFFAGGSLGLFKHFHLMAEYDDVGDYTFWNFGAGWHGLCGEPGDLFAQALWNDVEFDSGTNNVSDDGYEVDAGLRWKVVNWLELRGQVNWVDLDQGGDDTTFEAGALFAFWEDRIGIGASWETGDADTLRGFVRFSFGE